MAQTLCVNLTWKLDAGLKMRSVIGSCVLLVCVCGEKQSKFFSDIDWTYMYTYLYALCDIYDKVSVSLTGLQLCILMHSKQLFFLTSADDSQHLILLMLTPAHHNTKNIKSQFMFYVLYFIYSGKNKLPPLELSHLDKHKICGYARFCCFVRSRSRHKVHPTPD